MPGRQTRILPQVNQISNSVSPKRRTTRTLRGYYTGRDFLRDVKDDDLIYIPQNFSLEELFEFNGDLNYNFQIFDLALQHANQALLDEQEFEEELAAEEAAAE